MINHRLSEGPKRPRHRPIIALTVLITALGSGQGLAGRHLDESGPSWSYTGETGPDHWGSLGATYETCAKGRLQSPINISRAQRVAYTPLIFQYRSQLLEVISTAHGVHVISPPGSALVIRGYTYDLEEFNFHVPGEHRLNGVAAEAEMHLIHRDQHDGLVVVAVPIRSGKRENRILSRILEYLPTQPGQRVRQRQVGINPLFLLPSDRSYFRYTGSLAAPPCTEPVLWLVMAEPLDVSPEQILRIAQAVGINTRPVQPLNGRPVFALFRH